MCVNVSEYVYPIAQEGLSDCHYVTHDVIDWLELCTSIYSDVQIFADEIFADGC